MSAPDTSPPPNELATSTATRLHSAAIHLLRRLRREDDASGLSAPRLSALSVIVFGGPLSLGALAAAAPLPRPVSAPPTPASASPPPTDHHTPSTASSTAPPPRALPASGRGWGRGQAPHPHQTQSGPGHFLRPGPLS